MQAENSEHRPVIAGTRPTFFGVGAEVGFVHLCAGSRLCIDWSQMGLALAVHRHRPRQRAKLPCAARPENTGSACCPLDGDLNHCRCSPLVALHMQTRMAFFAPGSRAWQICFTEQAMRSFKGGGLNDLPREAPGEPCGRPGVRFLGVKLCRRSGSNVSRRLGALSITRAGVETPIANWWAGHPFFSPSPRSPSALLHSFGGLQKKHRVPLL